MTSQKPQPKGRDRELVKFFNSKEENKQPLPTLTDDGVPYDQFEENRKKYNVKSTYTFDKYTTKIDERKLTTDQKRKAEILAKEINEGEQKHDKYRKDLLREAMGDEIDEEALYSNVVREQPPAKKQ